MHPAVYQYNLAKQQNLIVSTVKGPTAKHKATSIARAALAEYVTLKLSSVSLNQALNEVLEDIERGTLPAQLLQQLKPLRKMPSYSTLRSWVITLKAKGIDGLLPNWGGTCRGDYGWELLALELYHRPQRPALKKVARDLSELHGFKNASYHNVWYFFENLPSNLQDKSPWRLGYKQYKDGIREHVKRTTETVPVGFLFQGDGHCVDQYVKHPKTGKLWRIELTIFMDIRSRYIAGWYVSSAESSISTMAALSHAMGTYDHVPAMLHIDHGSGFKSRLMNDETAGFYANFGIEPIFALPGNAKAKNVERWFRLMEDDFGKDWDTYCGYDMSNDASRHFSSDKIKKLEEAGKINIPTLAEWVEKFSSWLVRYHNRPHPEVKNATPASMWATLENVPVIDRTMLVRPRESVNVVKSTIRLHGRLYRNEYLYQLEGKTLVAEYDLHDDETIRLFDTEGRILCVAELKEKKAYLSKSRMEDAERNRLKNQNKRLENKQRENELRADVNGSLHVDQAKDISELGDSALSLDDIQQPANDDFDIDDITQQLMRQNIEHNNKDDEDDDTLFNLYNQ